MAETAVEISRCGACGADVRDESLFCYNCGASVTALPAASEVTDESGSAIVAGPGVTAPPLRSAASLRKHRRALNRQPVKVSWEPPDDSSKGFVITTIVLTTGALILLILAFYLR